MQALRRATPALVVSWPALRGSSRFSRLWRSWFLVVDGDFNDFVCSPLGAMIHFDTYFSKGWLNQQLSAEPEIRQIQHAASLGLPKISCLQQHHPMSQTHGHMNGLAMLFSCFGGNLTLTLFFRIGIVRYMDSVAPDDHSLAIHCIYTTYV